MTLRSMLYTWARLLGDLNAIKRGPAAVLKREGRKVVLRKVGRWLK